MLAFFKPGRFIRAFPWVLCAFLWLLTALQYAYLPAQIPTHFNFSGKADGYGSRNSIWILPLLLSIFLGIFSSLIHSYRKKQSLHDGNSSVTPKFHLLIRLLQLLSVSLGCLFLFLGIQTIRESKGMPVLSGALFVIIVQGLIWVPMAYFFYHYLKIKR